MGGHFRPQAPPNGLKVTPNALKTLKCVEKDPPGLAVGNTEGPPSPRSLSRRKGARESGLLEEEERKKQGGEGNLSKDEEERKEQGEESKEAEERNEEEAKKQPGDIRGVYVHI